MNHVIIDYVIVGTGVAGLCCALEASRSGSVALICKDKFPSGNTVIAQGGIAAALGLYDSPELHFVDTVRAGDGFCDENAVQVLVNEGVNRVEEILKMGFPYDEKDGAPVFSREGAHSVPRVLSSYGDSSGKALSDTLARQVKNKDNIYIYEDTFVNDAVMNDGKCAGVLAVENCTGTQIAFAARAVVLATGGCGQVYARTTNNLHCTGDGFAIAYRAGARLEDMEFVQFHPTALDSDDNPVFLISEAVRGKGGVLIDQTGRRFMHRYHSWGDLAPRDIVARAIFSEKMNGNSVFLDVSGLGGKFKELFPAIYKNCREKGVDLLEEPVPVSPAAHFIMGGVKTDLNGYTGIKGLYACGEVVCTRVHGANRLASNSLLEGLVFGFRTGHSLAGERESPGLTVEDNKTGQQSCNKQSVLDSESLINELKVLMWENVGLIRTGEGLSRAVRRTRQIISSVGAGDFVLKNMATAAFFIAYGALSRKESVGSHYRSDTVYMQKKVLSRG